MISETEISFFAILLASLIGSPHCAGMCGGFVALYSCGTPKSIISHIAYHCGRLCTYMILGGIAGYAGSRIDNRGWIVGLQRVSTGIVGVLLIMWGLVKLFPQAIRGISFMGWFKDLHTPMHYILGKRASLPPALFALLVGATSTFLPCGWLYMFVTVAAASGSWTIGIFVMAAFWLGTVPVLAGVAFATQFVSGSAMRYMPRITAGLVILAGLFSLSGHLDLLPAGLHDHGYHDHGHHDNLQP